MIDNVRHWVLSEREKSESRRGPRATEDFSHFQSAGLRNYECSLLPFPNIEERSLKPTLTHYSCFKDTFPYLPPESTQTRCAHIWCFYSFLLKTALLNVNVNLDPMYSWLEKTNASNCYGHKLPESIWMKPEKGWKEESGETEEHGDGELVKDWEYMT